MELRSNFSDQKDIQVKTIWLLLAIALSAFEMFLPRIPFLPWLKPGFANIITILWVIKFGIRDAVLFSILRSWIAGFYFGFSFTTMALSLGGGILSPIAMGAAWHFLGKTRMIGTVGLGMIGAVSHNIGQLCLIYLIMAQNSFIFYQLPFMCGASLIFGCLTGIAVPSFYKISEPFFDKDYGFPANRSLTSVPFFYNILSSVIFVACISLLLINSLGVLLVLAAITLLCVQLICGFSFKNLLYPVRYWMLFLFIGIIYLFFSYGTRIGIVPYITQEGLHSTGVQFLRLIIWLEAGLLLQRFSFHKFFFNILIKVFPSRAGTFTAGLLTLEYFPEIVRFSRSNKIRFDLKHPVTTVHSYIEHFFVHLENSRENKFETTALRS